MPIKRDDAIDAHEEKFCDPRPNQCQNSNRLFFFAPRPKIHTKLFEFPNPTNTENSANECIRIGPVWRSDIKCGKLGGEKRKRPRLITQIDRLYYELLQMLILPQT